MRYAGASVWLLFGVVMATRNLSHRIRVSSSISASGRTWTVFVADDRHAIFTGARAKERAVDAALRLAEDLRMHGAVVVVVDPVDGVPGHPPQATRPGDLLQTRYDLGAHGTALRSRRARPP